MGLEIDPIPSRGITASSQPIPWDISKNQVVPWDGMGWDGMGSSHPIRSPGREDKNGGIKIPYFFQFGPFSEPDCKTSIDFFSSSCRALQAVSNHRKFKGTKHYQHSETRPTLMHPS